MAVDGRLAAELALERGPAPTSSIAGDASAYDSSAAAGRVVERLKAERRALLASGQPYTAGHPLVRRIDRALHGAETAMRALAKEGR